MRFLIVSDSMGSLSAIANPYFSCPIISQIYTAWSDLKAVGKYVKLIWCPSHCGIRGNEAVDQAAKDPLSIIPRDHGNVAHLNICTPQDFKPWIAKLIKTQWQRSWDDIPNNKLKRIKPKIEEWPSSQRSTRMEEVVLTRLRIGHTRLTHKYLFTREPQPVCQCGETLSIQHILVCPTHVVMCLMKLFRNAVSKPRIGIRFHETAELKFRNLNYDTLWNLTQTHNSSTRKRTTNYLDTY
ncbi:hypothetical protein M8J77_022637 [Diaphorina citri]|nr:hypothetical protein M8J77_022637 [Diaphorina citri]